MRLPPLAIRILMLLPLLALAIFCVAYLAHDYDALARWYHSLPGSFYRKAQWQSDFFTPETKRSGNLFCSLALVGIAALAGVIGRQKFRKKRVDFRKLDPSFWILASVATVLGIWSATSLPPAADEAFSAKYVAGMHPLRALSYYMLPNNHVLFNTLNAFVSNENNALWHGRIVSILAYIGSGLLAYQWFREVISGKKTALGLALLQLTIFPVWGFAGQARGYELYLLAHWWTLLLVSRYLKTKDPQPLIWFPLAATIGYGAVPTFLYFHVALLAWMLYNNVAEKSASKAFWLAQPVAFAGAFLFYVPAMSFSGLGALIGNRYVSGGPRVAIYELPPLGQYAIYFNGMGSGGLVLSILVFALALSLLYRKRTRRCGVLFTALWAATGMVILCMSQLPFHRNLTGIYSVSFALACVGAANLFKKNKLDEFAKIPSRLAAGISVLIGCALLYINKGQLSDCLYFYPVRETAQRVEAEVLSKIPTHSKVAFSEEAFLAETFWKRRGGAVVAVKNAAFWVQFASEKLVSQTDTLLAQSEDLQLYKRR